MKINCVFINNLPIYLTDELEAQEHPHFYRFDKVDLTKIVDKMFKGKIREAYLYSEDISFLRRQFSMHFKLVKAAGGKVFNAHGDVLFIYRNGVWDLPKGKMEKDEKKKETALREVEEETGVTGLELGKQLETTYHIYRYKHKTVLKVSFWFEMFTASKAPLYPQIEEGISQVKWLTHEEVLSILPVTYANIRRLFSPQ